MPIEYHELSDATRHLLNAVADDVFDSPVIPQQADAFVDDSRHFMVLAVSDDRVVGMASAFEYLHPDKAPQLFINEAGVATPFRNQGIGRELVKRLIEMAESHGCEYAWLGTEPDNVPAVRCYSGIGGGNTPENFLLFEWPLQKQPE